MLQRRGQFSGANERQAGLRIDLLLQVHGAFRENQFAGGDSNALGSMARQEVDYRWRVIFQVDEHPTRNRRRTGSARPAYVVGRVGAVDERSASGVSGDQDSGVGIRAQGVFLVDGKLPAT